MLCICEALYIYTGWRRLIGSPKLQIIFHKRATKYRSLLQKMTYKDKGSYESSPPCTQTLKEKSYLCATSQMDAVHRQSLSKSSVYLCINPQRKLLLMYNFSNGSHVHANSRIESSIYLCIWVPILTQRLYLYTASQMNIMCMQIFK